MSTTSLIGSSDSMPGNIVVGEAAPSANTFLTDTIVATEVLKSGHIALRSATDTLAASDKAIKIHIAVDSITITDKVSSVGPYKGIPEHLPNSDALTRAPGSKISSSSLDTLVPTDSGKAVWTKNINIPASVLTVTDIADRFALRKVTKDSLVATDVAVGKRVHGVKDSLSPTDKLDVDGRFFAGATDNIVASDKVTRTTIRSRSVPHDLIIWAEGLVHFFEHSSKAADALTPSEHLVKSTLFKNAHDTLTGTVSVSTLRIHHPAARDVGVLVDKVSRGPSIFTHNAKDSLTSTEYASGTKVVEDFRIFVDLNNPSHFEFVLPEPEFNNAENSINKYVAYRSEKGTFYTYVQRTGRLKTYVYNFILTYNQFRNLEQYLYARGQQPPSRPPQKNLYLYIAYRADVFRMKLLTTSLMATNVSGSSDLYRVNLEFEGIRLVYGGGRQVPICA